MRMFLRWHYPDQVRGCVLSLMSSSTPLHIFITEQHCVKKVLKICFLFINASCIFGQGVAFKSTMQILQQPISYDATT